MSDFPSGCLSYYVDIDLTDCHTESIPAIPFVIIQQTVNLLLHFMLEALCRNHESRSGHKNVVSCA